MRPGEKYLRGREGGGPSVWRLGELARNRAEQSRMRSELLQVAGRRPIRYWRACGTAGATSFDRITLAFTDRSFLEIYSTGLDDRGRIVGLLQLRRQDFREPFSRGTASCLELTLMGGDGWAGRPITSCRITQDGRGETLTILGPEGILLNVRATAVNGRGAIISRLRHAHDWE